MKIIGVDIASIITGWSYLDETKLLTGIIATSKEDTLEKRLLSLYDNFKDIIEKYAPDLIAVENQYFKKNVSTLKILSQARGIIMLVAAQYNIKLRVIEPTTAKLAITGSGKASKKDVRKSVCEKYKIEDITEDEADAVAIAYAAFLKQED